MGISGCKGNTEEPVSSEPIEMVSEKGMDDNFINIPIDIYAEATTKNKLKDMETVRKVVERFGECGYAAVDCENRVDMTQIQNVIDFCDSVEKQEKAEVTILQVSSLGGFSVYYLQTEKGVVHVKRCYYGYKDGIMKSEDEGEYQTDYWRYTDDGYLMFSGTYFSEELYVLTLSSAEEHVAFRILPLDAKCRELNEKYLLPIGYELNNMFLVDWNEDDFGELNFYDMFDLLYPKLHNEKFPYVADDNLGIGAVYHIPKTEFENVIMEYFNIDSDKLQKRIKEWKYTDKGWFCYELCVPEPPEVTEIVDGSCLVRIKPLSKEQREMSERCVQGLGYQGNNLLCSNWDTDHMEKLDYNGMYEYLYAMKHQKAFDAEDYSNGIPKEEFESLIMEYLPVTAEQIQEYAVFDEKNQTYVWVRQGCLNYAPTFFGTSLPEVIDIKENEDGTVTLTVDAVCDMVICDDAVITHELTVKFADDGSFQYLGNEILDDGIMHIPDYQYRIKE